MHEPSGRRDSAREISSLTFALAAYGADVGSNSLSAAFLWADFANLLADYTLKNPDTLTKYKTAAQISEKVLSEVSKLCVAGEKIVTICDKGDKLLEEELAKVYRGKKITKGISLPSASARLPSISTLGNPGAHRHRF